MSLPLSRVGCTKGESKHSKSLLLFLTLTSGSSHSVWGSLPPVVIPHQGAPHLWESRGHGHHICPLGSPPLSYLFWARGPVRTVEG